MTVGGKNYRYKGENKQMLSQYHIALSAVVYQHFYPDTGVATCRPCWPGPTTVSRKSKR